MSAPLVVNTRDGACWTRRTVTEGGIALYALADVCQCPEFVMVTLAELAERGIVGSADALPVPVGPERTLAEKYAEAVSTVAQLVLERGERMKAENALRGEVAELRVRVAELEAAAYGDATVRLLAPVDQIRHLHAAVAAQMSRAETLDRLLREAQAKLAEFERSADAEASVPRTEHERWVAIADALNAAHAAGMPVGIDLDGTLTDRRMWSVVWDRDAERWTVAGYEDDDETAAEVEPAPVTIYRAEHPDSGITLGHYSTIAAAHKHCETLARREGNTGIVSWVPDDGDPWSPEELTFFDVEYCDGDDVPAQTCTGYVVTPLEAPSEYDEEADE